MDFQDRSVVVTGGTGALGSAVVGALLEAGASCHIPVFNEAELTHFAYRAHPKVATYPGSNLTDEAAVTGCSRRCRSSGRRSTSPVGSPQGR